MIGIYSFKDIIAAAEIKKDFVYLRANDHHLIEKASYLLELGKVNFFMIDFSWMSWASKDYILELMMKYKRICKSKCKFIFIPIVGPAYTKDLFLKANHYGIKDLIVCKNYLEEGEYTSKDGYVEDFFSIRSSKLCAMLGIDSIYLTSSNTSLSKIILTTYQNYSVKNNFNIYIEGPKNDQLLTMIEKLKYNYYWDKV